MHSTNCACVSYFKHWVCLHAGAKTSLQVLATFIDDTTNWGKHTVLQAEQQQQEQQQQHVQTCGDGMAKYPRNFA